MLVAVPAQLGQPFLGGPGTVAADQDRLTVQLGVGDLVDRLIGEPDVVGGGCPPPALPGRSIPANASLVLSNQTSNG